MLNHSRIKELGISPDRIRQLITEITQQEVNIIKDLKQENTITTN